MTHLADPSGGPAASGASERMFVFPVPAGGQGYDWLNEGKQARNSAVSIYPQTLLSPLCYPSLADFGLEAKNYVDSLSERLRDNKALYSQTLKHLEAISDRIHESRRNLHLEGEHWVSEPQSTFLPACFRGSGVGAEAKPEPPSEALQQRLSSLSSSLPPPCSPPDRRKRIPSIVASIPHSPRRTPPGQLDTDIEEEGSLPVGETASSDFLPILNGLKEALQSCKITSDECGQWSNLQVLAHWGAVTIPTSFDVYRSSVGPRNHPAVSFATPQLLAPRQLRQPGAQSHNRRRSC
nr:unnamed protein product [Spirometra erinaceieuropaei]